MPKIRSGPKLFFSRELRFADCFRDHRQPAQIEHSVREVVAQRVYGLALGYEDLNDHDQLRSDPLCSICAGCR